MKKRPDLCAYDSSGGFMRSPNFREKDICSEGPRRMRLSGLGGNAFWVGQEGRRTRRWRGRVEFWDHLSWVQ